MQHARSAGRAALLALTLLSACAASQPSSPAEADVPPKGAIGHYLAGRYALGQRDYGVAATELLRASAMDPDSKDLKLQAFIACLNAGRPETVALARQLPDSQLAQFVLADVEIKSGDWEAAVSRFQALPQAGLTQLLRPLLLAWAQAGDAQTDRALATLQPYVENTRLPGVFALHAALIADLGKRPDDAARLYRVAQNDLASPNLRLVQILASWQARNGQAAEAQHTLSTLPPVAPDMAIALPDLLANVTKRQVKDPREGIAESYFTFAAILRAQNQIDLATMILQLALDLRPDFTAARVLAADTLALQNHPQTALKTLAEIPADDPVISVVQLRRADLEDRLGHSDDALKDLERLAQTYSFSPLPDHRRGEILRAKKRYGEAVSAFDRAIARIGQPQEGDWLIYYDRGVSREQAHNWPKAVEDFKVALQLSPNQPFILNYLGYSWAERGEHLNEAREMIEKAAAARPNDGAITDSLGWIMLRQGDAKGAVKTLERAVELEPEDATINSHLGDAYAAVGRKVEAQYQWRRALTLHPTPDDAAKLEAKLNIGHAGAVVSNP
jgi:tetratricopeptide (TPR) repeat protein